MKLFIIRHAQAEVGRDDDPKRMLDKTGQQQAQQLAAWLSTKVSGHLCLLASPYLRAQQTAQAVAQQLQIQVQENSLFIPSADSQQALAQLSEYQQDVMLISHQPLVGRLANLLVSGQDDKQPWLPAECRILKGDCAYSGCMQIDNLWYPN